MPWQCAACTHLSPKWLSRLEVAFLDGGLKPRQREKVARVLLGAMHGPSVCQSWDDDEKRAMLVIGGELIDRHLQVCLTNAHRSRYARAVAQYNMLWDALSIAHREYKANPDSWNAQAYTQMVHQLRGLLSDLDKIQDATEIADDLTTLALNPLVRRVTNTIISEAGRLKEDLLQHKLSQEVVDRIVGSFIRRIAPSFSDATLEARDLIEDTLGAKDKARGRKAMKRSSGRKTPLRIVK